MTRVSIPHPKAINFPNIFCLQNRGNRSINQYLNRFIIPSEYTNNSNSLRQNIGTCLWLFGAMNIPRNDSDSFRVNIMNIGTYVLSASNKYTIDSLSHANIHKQIHTIVSIWINHNLSTNQIHVNPSLKLFVDSSPRLLAQHTNNLSHQQSSQRGWSRE